MDRRPLSPGRGAGPRWVPPGPVVALAAMVAVYVAVFGWLTWQQQSNYGTFGYDMGLHDQGIWLTSRFVEPFDTIRGMHYFGHHVNLVSLLYVPLYWLGAGPHVLYLSETMALASGAVPVWLLARHRLAPPLPPATPGAGADGADGAEGRRWWRARASWLALVPAAAYLLHPSVEWTNWWHWHPEALAVAPLLFAWWFAVTRRWGWFAACVALALSTKEDVALAVVMLGLVLAVVGGRRRPGLLTAAAGLAWFAVCTRLVIPRLLDGGPFYERLLFPDFGDSLGSVLAGMAGDPAKVVDLATRPDRITYYAKLLGPLALLPLVGAPFLLIAGPQMGVNVLSSLPGTHDIRFHYSAVVVAAMFIATVEALGLLARLRRTVAVFAIGVLAASSVLGNMAWSPSPLGRDFDSGIWARRVPRHDVFDRAVALVPDGAGVSASYYLIPHLTHRRHAYEWPNPWILANWGVADENPPDPATADYIVLDTNLGQEPDLLAGLLAPGGGYATVMDEDGVVVARRLGR